MRYAAGQPHPSHVPGCRGPVLAKPRVEEPTLLKDRRSALDGGGAPALLESVTSAASGGASEGAGPATHGLDFANVAIFPRGWPGIAQAARRAVSARAQEVAEREPEADAAAERTGTTEILREARTGRRTAAPFVEPVSMTGIGFPHVQRQTSLDTDEEPQAEPEAELDAEPEADEETEVQPKLDLGPPDDAYEREADAIASTVMRMPEEGDSPWAPPSMAAASVQRRCAACDDEDRVRRAGGATGGPTSLAASASQLTSGGRPLPVETRQFYESRLGRDLSRVRLHQGSDAQALNKSIDARAFTYESHIWLTPHEPARPSLTLSHELAHVLQQTRPKALEHATGAATRDAAIQIQPARNARWVPTRSKKFTGSRGASHDAVVTEVSDANPDILAEVPIPNAGRMPATAAGVKPTQGYADFFKAKKNPDSIPGVRLVDAAQAPSFSIPVALPATATPAPSAQVGTPATPGAAQSPAAAGGPTTAGVAIANFNKTGADGWGARGRKVLKDGKEHKISGHQHPRVTNKGGPPMNLVGVGTAPASIQLGELKPGHNVKQRRKGATGQLPRYERALEQIASAVNAVPQGQRDQRWTLGNLGRLKTNNALATPASLSRTSTNKRFHRQLKLVARTTSGKNRFRSATSVPGRLVFGRDKRKGNQGVWTYIWVPQDASVSAGDIARAGQQHTAIQTLGRELDALVRELTKPPSKVQPKRLADASGAATGGAELRAGPRKVRRAPAISKRKNHTDKFDHRKWEKARAGRGQPPSFRAKVETLVGQDLKSPEGLQLRAAMEAAYQEIADELADFSPPKLTQQERGDVKALRKMQRMAGRLGKVLGQLRKRFGTVFVRVANGFEGFKDKLRQRVDRPRGAGTRGKLGGWKKTVVLMLTAGVAQAIKLLAADIVRRFAVCLDGMSSKLVEKLEAELDKELGTDIAAVRGELNELTKGFDEIKDRLDTEAEPWLARLDELDKLLDDYKKFEPYLDGIELTVRGLILASSCSGAGVGCLVGIAGQVAVGQFIAWAADTDAFRRAVINPVVHDLVRPLSEDAFRELVDALLGAPDAKTIRGRLRILADESGACQIPDAAAIGRSSGLGGEFPAATSKAEQTELIQKALKQYAAENAEAIRDAVRDKLKNPGGQPVTRDQIDGLMEALETAELTIEEATEILKQARDPDGKTDLGKVRDALEGRILRGPPEETTPADEPEPPPDLPFLRLEQEVIIPGGGPRRPKPRVEVGPLEPTPGQSSPPAGVGVKVRF